MITCTTCGTGNPLGTRWCRQCGAKLNLEIAQVNAAMAETDAADQDQRWISFGNSTLSVGVFLLLAVIVLRVALVPALPTPEPTPVLPADLIPDAAPPVTVKTDAPPTNVVVASRRLAWRGAVCRSIANELGLDLTALDATRQRIAAAQGADGTWPGTNRLAATGLATLALQAWPSDTSLGQAERGRTWLRGQLKDPTRLEPLGRSLAIAALSDAEELDAGELRRMDNYCIDGKAPIWQAWLLAALPAASRPDDAPLVHDAAPSDLWRWQSEASLGKTPALERHAFFAEAAPTVSSEDRPAWVALAWRFAPAPSEFNRIMQEWSRAAVTAAPASLAPAGASAADALWLIGLSAAWRLPAVPATP